MLDIEKVRRELQEFDDAERHRDRMYLLESRKTLISAVAATAAITAAFFSAIAFIVTRL